MMTPNQASILNALVTFAAEHIPGGLSPQEREVAQMVGRRALAADSTGLRIESDGTARGTNVFVEDGRRVERVRRVAWDLDARTGLAEVKIELHGVPVDITLADDIATWQTTRILPDHAMQAARDKADEWNICDPVTYITADAVLAIVDAFVAAIAERKL